MEGPVPIQDTMASDTGPSNTIKLLQLLFLSTSWGMQVWVTFVAGRLGVLCSVPSGVAQGTGLCPSTHLLSPCRVCDEQAPPSPHLRLHPA